jgi:hypothetical protein
MYNVSLCFTLLQVLSTVLRTRDDLRVRRSTRERFPKGSFGGRPLLPIRSRVAGRLMGRWAKIIESKVWVLLIKCAFSHNMAPLFFLSPKLFFYSSCDL